jgi:hypothetical protein
MITLLLAAMYSGSGSSRSRSHVFLASFDDGDADCSGCTSAKSRYDGLWSYVFNGLSVQFGGDDGGLDWLVLPDINSAFAHLMCSNLSDSSSSVRVHASQMLPTLLRSSRYFGAAIDSDFGPPSSSPLIFYLSRLLLVPPPAVRMEAAAAVEGLRQGGAWLVGVHMRWVTNGRQYLLPGDMTSFVCACAAAAHRHRATRFYVASDSVAAEELLVQRLQRHNASWQVIVSHASSNTSDGDTVDALLDLSILSECDDLIVTHHSSYAQLAASFGGHRPIVVGAHLSAKYGVCNPQRAAREDSVLFSNLQQPRSLVMQQVYDRRACVLLNFSDLFVCVSDAYFCHHHLCAYSFFGPRHTRRHPPGSTPPAFTAPPLLSPMTTCSNLSLPPPRLMQLCPRHQRRLFRRLPNAMQHPAEAAVAVRAG